MKRTWMALATLSIAGFVIGAAIAAPKGPSLRVPVGAPVRIELAEPISTKLQKAGDTFAIRLAEPLVVRGRIVAAKGAPGVGTIVDLSRPGMGGRAAKLVLAANYITQGKVRIALRGLQVSATGRGFSNTANAVGIGGIAFAPLGFAAMAIHGGDVALPAGAGGMAKVAAAVTLPSLGLAPHAAAPGYQPDGVQGAIKVPPPPPGQGEVVFFRPKSVLGTGQWFNVRENGKALGKLTNGDYFVQITAPGLHTYTATTEPEFKNSLRLQIDPGETYFVEGGLTKGVIIGSADLSPSDGTAFAKASRELKAAPPVEEKAKGSVSR